MPYGSINADLIVGTNGNKISPENTFGFRNRIINGAMVIDQRNSGASVTPTVAQYTVDRFFVQVAQASKFSIQQNAGSVTPPVGFKNYLGATSLANTSLAAGDYYTIQQSIEGLNVYDLAWGTANAKTVTLSFQVYSSLTGTFGGALSNNAFNRSYPFTYSIPTANTWTTISITIAGDTTGTWLTTNGTGIQLIFGLGIGSTYSGTAGAWAASGYLSATGATSVVGTSGATFYITGVQLEVGSNATNFEYRPYGTELALCQRYCQVLGGVANQRYGTGWFFSATNGYPFITTTVSLRSPLNVTISYSALSDFVIYSGGTPLTPSAIVADTGSQNGVSILVSVTGATTGYAATLVATGSTSSRLYLLNEL